MRKASREMNSDWALGVMRRAPYITVSFTRPDGTRYRGHGLYAAVSYDEGRTWETRRLLTDGRHELLNAGAWTQWFEADDTHAEPRGYLAATQTPDGMIHLVSSRFYYRFNLPWLEEVKGK